MLGAFARALEIEMDAVARAEPMKILCFERGAPRAGLGDVEREPDLVVALAGRSRKLHAAAFSSRPAPHQVLLRNGPERAVHRHLRARVRVERF